MVKLVYIDKIRSSRRWWHRAKLPPPTPPPSNQSLWRQTGWWIHLSCWLTSLCTIFIAPSASVGPPKTCCCLYPPNELRSRWLKCTQLICACKRTSGAFVFFFIIITVDWLHVFDGKTKKLWHLRNNIKVVQNQYRNTTELMTVELYYDTHKRYAS